MFFMIKKQKAPKPHVILKHVLSAAGSKVIFVFLNRLVITNG